MKIRTLLRSRFGSQFGAPASSFFTSVVFAVLNAVHTPEAKLTTALVGILYATIRTGFVGFSLYYQSLFPPIALQIDRIHVVVTETALAYEPAEIDRIIRKAKTPLYFEMVGLSVIYFMCLVQIFALTSEGSV